MTLHTGYMNIYRSGYFHTCGKPGAWDRHPGDIYATEGAALASIEPRSHYIATVPVQWEEDDLPPPNPGADPWVWDTLTPDHVGEVRPV